MFIESSAARGSERANPEHVKSDSEHVSHENTNKWPPLLLRSFYLHDFMFIKWTPIVTRGEGNCVYIVSQMTNCEHKESFIANLFRKSKRGRWQKISRHCIRCLLCAPRRSSVMLSTRGRIFQGFSFIPSRETVEHELPAAGGDSGGADASHRRRPAQLRHRPQRGELPGPAPHGQRLLHLSPLLMCYCFKFTMSTDTFIKHGTLYLKYVYSAMDYCAYNMFLWIFQESKLNSWVWLMVM